MIGDRRFAVERQANLLFHGGEKVFLCLRLRDP